MSAPAPSSSPSDVEKADVESSSRVMTDQERGYARIPNVDDERTTERSYSNYRPAPSPPPGLTTDAGLHPGARPPAQPAHGYGEYYDFASNSAQEFWDRLKGKDRRWIGWGESAKNIVLSSCEYRLFFAPRRWLDIAHGVGLNVLFIVIPFAWVSFWVKDREGERIWGGDITFVCAWFPCICA